MASPMQCLMAEDGPGDAGEMNNVGNAPFQGPGKAECRHILAVLNHVGGSRTKAAKITGIGRKTLHRKQKAFDLV